MGLLDTAHLVFSFFPCEPELECRKDLEKIAQDLSLLSEHGLRDFYQRAYRECRVINSHAFPPPRALQELVQAWTQLRKWRKP